MPTVAPYLAEATCVESSREYEQTVQISKREQGFASKVLQP